MFRFVSHHITLFLVWGGAGINKNVIYSFSSLTGGPSSVFRFQWRVPCTRYCLSCISQVYLPSCGLVRISPEHFANWKRFCTFVQFRRNFEQKYFISVSEKHFITEWAPAISANQKQTRACGLLGPKKELVTLMIWPLKTNYNDIYLSKAVPIIAVKHQ